MGEEENAAYGPEEDRQKVRARLREHLDKHPKETEAAKKFARLTRERVEAIGQHLQIAFSGWPSVENDGWESVQAVWQFCRDQLSAHRREGWHLIKEHERELTELMELTNEELERELEQGNESEALFRHILQARNRYAVNLFTLRLFTRQYLATYDIPPELSQEEAKQIVAGTSGRSPTIDDPSAYPVETLKALLKWTADEANRAGSFRGKDSLCGFIAQQLEPHAGYEVSQATIRSRLESLMESLDVNLPHGPTNKLSYFEARGEIEEAMKAHGLLG